MNSIKRRGNMSWIKSSKLLFFVFLGLLVMVSTVQATVVTDSFTRANGPTFNDSIGDAEVPAGTYHWYEGYLIWDYLGDAGAISAGKAVLHSSGGGRQITLNTDSADVIAETEVTFALGAGAAPAANAMMFLRKGTVLGGGLFWNEVGLVSIQFSPSGLLTVTEFTAGGSVTLYNQNPWTASTADVYGAAGSLPATVNGVDFDVDQDGRIGAGTTSLENFTLGADLQGTALSVSINGQVFFSGSVAGTSSSTGNNSFSLSYNSLAGTGTVVTHYDDVNLDLVPEPASMGMLLIGGVMGLLRRRRK